jgi:hypothetical protein
MAKTPKAKSGKAATAKSSRTSAKMLTLRVMDGLNRGRAPRDALYYDRRDMNVKTPAERIKSNPAKVDKIAEAEFMKQIEPLNWLDALNGAVRRSRRELYYRRLAANPKAKRIVSEGDSWHLFPVLLDEIIDHLNKDKSLAIFSTDAAGDTISKMWSERLQSNRGFQSALTTERPSVFLINGGGNDLLQTRKGPDGKPIGNLYFHLKNYVSGMTAKQLIKPSLDDELEAVHGHVRAIIGKAVGYSWVKKVLLHGYDYAFPDNDLWLGKPMASRGINSAALQRQIVIEVMDRVHDGLTAVAKAFESSKKVNYVDVRRTVTSKAEWYDEIHPKSPGFKKIAAKIRAHI